MRRSRSSALVLAASAWSCTPAPVSPAAASCPADRQVVVASKADLERLAACTSIGGLTVRSGAALEVSALRRLTTITGDLVLGPTVAIEEVTLGGLRSVGGTFHVVGNGLLHGLFLPKLERAGRIEIEGNGALTTISLPRLAATGALRVTDNASLELLDVSALTAVEQELVLDGAPRLTVALAEQLARAAEVQITAPSLPPDVVGRLRGVAKPVGPQRGGITR